ncbi:MAG: hypothetical protein R6W88_14570 [Desulfobacterales bacterium]
MTKTYQEIKSAPYIDAISGFSLKHLKTDTQCAGRRLEPFGPLPDKARHLERKWSAGRKDFIESANPSIKKVL